MTQKLTHNRRNGGFQPPNGGRMPQLPGSAHGVHTLRSKHRRGAVAVEFAIVAPVLVAIVFGITQVSEIYSVQNLLQTAAREGARFGATDRTGMVGEGGSSNDKLAQDVKNFLAAQGLSADDVTVSVTHPESTDEFDLDDPNNSLELFEVHVELPYSSFSSYDIAAEDDYDLEAVATFRNTRATFSN